MCFQCELCAVPFFFVRICYITFPRIHQNTCLFEKMSIILQSKPKRGLASGKMRFYIKSKSGSTYYIVAFFVISSFEIAKISYQRDRQFRNAHACLLLPPIGGELYSGQGVGVLFIFGRALASLERMNRKKSHTTFCTF